MNIKQFTQAATSNNAKEYTKETAHVIGTAMAHFNTNNVSDNKYQFAQTYGLRKGLNKFGEKGTKAVNKKLGQLHSQNVFEPIRLEDLSSLERKRAMESLTFLTEKWDKTIKAQACANGSTQQTYIAREEAASPTAAKEAILITGVIEAKQQRDIMTLDIPNTFAQTPVL
jgi:hypothetical protein